MDVLARILAYLHARSQQKHEVIGVPPFTLYLHLSSSALEDNVALPNPSPTEDVNPALERLTLFFENRNRIARIQFLDQQTPELAAYLIAAGYTMDEKLPVLYCVPGQLRQPDSVPSLQISVLDDRAPDHLLAEGWTLNALGFDAGAKAATPEDVDAFRPMLVRGRAFSAHLASVGVGAGMFNEPLEGVAELVGITTLHPFRRKGIATTLTASMTAVAFETGATLAFLVAVSPEASRVYMRIGYQFCGHLVTFTKLSNGKDAPV
jgi:hypothetical protein